MKRHRVKRAGKVVVLFALLIPTLAGMGAFAIDVGNMEFTRSQLQAGADAGALAAARQLSSDQATLDSTAEQYATVNAPSGSNLQVTAEPGTWDDNTLTFTPSNLSVANAVRVTVVRVDSELFFGGIFGAPEVDISASAVAVGARGGARFLIDDEVIDIDVPTLENLAAQYGVTPDELLSDADGDWFIDLPPGETIELPTGQVGDSGLFDRDHPEFPFGEPGNPTMEEFLMYSENGGDLSKGGIEDPAVKDMLDPLPGVSAVEDPSLYPAYVDPHYVHVSPIHLSDISALDPEYGVPQINAQGMRRGLLAFKIIAIGADPDGPGGNVLPNIIVEIVDPTTIVLSDIASSVSTNAKVRLVQ